MAETRGYDKRFRLTSLADGTVYNLSVSYAPNGNASSANDSANGNWTYTYDDFNRLVTSSCSSHCPDGQNTQAFSYVYDRFGNRWQQNVTAGTGGSSSLSFDANNHIVGSPYSYDAVGDLLNDGSHSYTYDAEGRVTSVPNSSKGSTCSIYNADGERVRKTYSTQGTCAQPTSSTTNDYILDVASHIIRIAGIRNEVYIGNRHLVTDVFNSTYFIHTDWLGTDRARSSVTGSSYDTVTSLPFGDSLTVIGGADTGADHFTGQFHDFDANIDYFHARHLGSNLGRFMSPDPLGGHLVDPQTLNKYVYVRDNPVSLTDPTGLDLWLKGCGKKDTATCHKNYVGTWDKNHKHFTRTHIKGDQRQNATLGPHGITVKQGKNTYQGVWDTNKGEQNAVDVAGAGALSPFSAEINGNCGGTCVASGTLYNASGFGTTQQTLASASAVYNALNAPGSGYVRNRGFDGIDFFHPGDVNFRGYSDTDPDLLFSTHVPVPLKGGWNNYIHVDSVYPYDDLVDFFTHGASVVRSLVAPH